MYRDNSQIYLLIKRGSIKFSFVHESEIWEASPPFLRKRFKRVRMNEWGLWLIWPWKARGYWRETCSSDFMQERKITQKKRSNSILLPCINFLNFVKIFSRYSHLCYNEKRNDDLGILENTKIWMYYVFSQQIFIELPFCCNFWR